MQTKITPHGDYIHGQYLQINDPNGEIPSVNPGDLSQTPIAFPYCYEHVHEAVAAAKNSFNSWKRLKPGARLDVLTNYRHGLSRHKEALALTMAREIGLPLWETRLEIEETLRFIDHFLSDQVPTAAPESIPDVEPKATGAIRFLPRGVMVVISPAVQAILLPHAQFIPSLVYGNTVVLKVSKIAPATGQCLMEIVHDAAFPPGVLNLIQGDSEVARRLTSHPDVDGIFFTGSFETASKLRKQVSNDYGKVVVLDTGGANATVLWSDCNYPKALQETFFAAYVSAGQRAASTGRILVHEKIFDRFLADFHALAKRCRVGYALTEGGEAPFMGPLVGEETMENYLRFQGIAVREGCEEIMRGKTLERDKKGYYVSPSIHLVHQPDPKSIYQTSEILGPNVALHKVSGIEETADIINLPRYGLVTSIYTAARETYLRLAEDAHVGILHWNAMTTHHNPRLPYGGVKKSGNHRPMGSYALYQCTFPMSSLEYPESVPVMELPPAFPR